MLGQRFYDETGRQFTANNYKGVDPYVHGHYLNAQNIRWSPNNFLNAAMAGIGDGHNGGGPIWAIFDQGAVEREKWDPNPPNVDVENGFFFKADTIGRARGEDRDEVPARADAARQSRSDGRALQHLRRHRPRLRLRQAAAAVQDREAAVLRRLVRRRCCTTPARACASTRAARSST